jgi:hypothetical protein
VETVMLRDFGHSSNRLGKCQNTLGFVQTLASNGTFVGDY